MNQEKLTNFVIEIMMLTQGNSMFKFCINRKIFNFFKRKDCNFMYRLTSYRLIRILGKRFAKQFASNLSGSSLTVRQSPLVFR